CVRHLAKGAGHARPRLRLHEDRHAYGGAGGGGGTRRDITGTHSYATSFSVVKFTEDAQSGPAGRKGENAMEIKRCGSRPTRRAPASSFTGTVWQDPVIDAPAPALLKSTVVSFEPSARTAWHTHPLGQTLYVISGAGRIQVWGGPIEEIKAGDVVWIPPGEKHWHGAAPDTMMIHISMQEGHNGVVVEWLEHVTDEQYM